MPLDRLRSLGSCSARFHGVPVSRICCGGGQLQVTSTNGSSADYRALRIAGADAQPLNDSFNWPALSSAQAPGHEPYPTYNPKDPDASVQGGALVRRVSADLETDAGGRLAQWLAAYARPDAPAVTVTVGAAPVTVENGWYILTAAGRQPMFAWVDGALVTLGDKSDAPVLSKQVNTGEGWVESAQGGSAGELRYRIDVTLPTSIDAHERYELSIHDAWDEGLVFQEDSVQVELLPAEGKPRDITDSAEMKNSEHGFDVKIANVHELGAHPGDVVRVLYAMDMETGAQLDAGGLQNTAYATYTSWDGEGETPTDDARVYAVRIRIKKVNEKGAPLAGAEFGVRDAEGAWLAADGSFGKEAGRATFTSSRQGVVADIPPLAAGSYKLAELKAPKGYQLASPAEMPFDVKLGIGTDALDITAWANEPLAVASVEADSVTVTFELENRKSGPGEPDDPGGTEDPNTPSGPDEPSGPGEPGGADDSDRPGNAGDTPSKPDDAEKPGQGGLLGLIPKTGDTAWWLVAAALMVAGVTFTAAGACKRRQHKDA